MLVGLSQLFLSKLILTQLCFFIFSIQRVKHFLCVVLKHTWVFYVDIWFVSLVNCSHLNSTSVACLFLAFTSLSDCCLDAYAYVNLFVVRPNCESWLSLQEILTFWFRSFQGSHLNATLIIVLLTRTQVKVESNQIRKGSKFSEWSDSFLV